MKWVQGGGRFSCRSATKVMAFQEKCGVRIRWNAHEWGLLARATHRFE